MQKPIYLLVILAVLLACADGNQKNSNKKEQTTDTITEKPIEATNNQSPLAYLIDGELYFHNFEDNKKVKFTEEPEEIFNFAFDTEGKTLYYNVERDNTLWLKSADISESNITLKWLINWELNKDECISQTYLEASPLYYYHGQLMIQHDFIWEFYDFNSIAIYSIDNNNITQKANDYRLLQKITAELSYDKSNEYFQTINEQLYYTNNNTKICLTDKLNFKAIMDQDNSDFWVEIEFRNFIFSVDKSKILFGAILGFGDLVHGPYCIANTDGSNQLLLEQTDIGSNNKPIWLKNNYLAFLDDENNLYIANNNENSIQKIAKNVSAYKSR